MPEGKSGRGFHAGARTMADTVIDIVAGTAAQQ
jgi:hypothetical protein